MATNNNFPSLDTSGNRGVGAGAGAGVGTGTSPIASNAGQVNGNGVVTSANYMSPLPVGHQQDLNFLYVQIQELSEILRANREKVNVITRTAEEVAKRQNGVNGGGLAAGVQEGNGSHDADSELYLLIHWGTIWTTVVLLMCAVLRSTNP